MKKVDVIVLGAGIAGLVASKCLKDEGVDVLCIEKEDRVGGRIASDKKDGFILDRGFQVYLSHYDEPKKFLDFKELDLQSFTSGSYLCHDQKKSIMADPSKSLFLGLKSLKSLPFNDLWLLNKLQLQLKSRGCLDVDDRQSTLHFLKRFGFSDTIISQFFLLCFFKGDAVIPKQGMQAIPNQVADALKDNIRLNEEILSIQDNKILTKRNVYQANYIISALDYTSLIHLYGMSLNLRFNSTLCFYFSAERVKDNLPILYLLSDKASLINHFTVLTKVSKSYSSDHRELISVTLKSTVKLDFALEKINTIKEEIYQYLDCRELEYITHYEIKNALPFQAAPLPKVVDKGLVFAGDWTEQGSINGAVKSGRLAAERVLEAVKHG